ncbi:uncharacterized protein LOC115596432 [Sparus aurata]|uniref:uncharacterized protein LOC115596432 n=1 Tax=Sparus aurata TaxID=8175 RepID=UPI0011C1A208|nr:uncharacterized protein LOC115596432 [Sparus aurata]
MSTDHLQPAFRTVTSLEEAKSTRDRLSAEKINHMKNDVTELKLREDLFSEYLKTLQDIHKNTDEDEKRAVVAVMNEFWGIWLQTKSEEIEQLKRNELQTSLKAELSSAKSQSQSQTSPCSSIYHYIKFGNIALSDKQWNTSIRLFERAMEQDESWAAIAFYNHAYCIIQQQSADYLAKARDDLMKAKESLKYLSEECMICLQLVKMSSANLTNSDASSLEKQLTNKCTMLSYFDKNISEAIKKLDEIKEGGKDAVAKKSPICSLVKSADKDLQVEADNLYSQGLKYVFSVEVEPCFPWGALVEFLLGVLQVVVGAVLITVTFGTFANFGLGLIAEGITDCISGIESMVKGEFSWKSWAINKAISIGLALVGFGVGKLIAKGFKACKTAIKGFGKQLKSMPKFLSSQTKEGLSVVAKTNMNNAGILVAKKMVEETIMYGIGKVEDMILNEILNSIKDQVKEMIVKNVKSNMETKPLAASVDLIIFSHLEDKKQLSDLLKDENRRNDLLATFRQLINAAVQPFYADLSWQNKLHSTIYTVIDSAKAKASGKAEKILNVIKFAHMAALAGEAVFAVNSLSSKFFSNLKDQLDIFTRQSGFSEEEKVNELSDSDSEMLKEFKQDLIDTISASLADAVVEVFHQKISSHMVSLVQGKINGFFRCHVRTDLNSGRTEELLRAGQNNRYIAHMPVDKNPRQDLSVKAVQHSQSHAEDIINSGTPGTILDIRVLSEATGTNVVILTEDSKGRLIKMQELSPGTKPSSQTVTLIYRPKSDQYPDGHYDVQINNQTVSIVSEHGDCLFHAWARGTRPEASEREVASEAQRLRSLENKTLLTHPGQWEPFVKRKVWTDSIRGGDWFMSKGAANKPLTEAEEKEILKKLVGQIQLYKDKANQGIGHVIHADHQPPVKSIVLAGKLNQNSRLAKAFLEVATNSSPLNDKLIDKVRESHGPNLPTVYVPAQIHMEFPSTRSPAYRELLAESISNNDVEATFKLMIIGSMPRFRLNSNNNFNNFQHDTMSKTRLARFEASFQQHSINMVEWWSNRLQDKGVMTETQLDNIREWTKKSGYNDQNDRYRNKVSDLL